MGKAKQANFIFPLFKVTQRGICRQNQYFPQKDCQRNGVFPSRQFVKQSYIYSNLSHLFKNNGILRSSTHNVLTNSDSVLRT